MGFYQRHILPRLISGGMRNSVMTEKRPRIAPFAKGQVLEVGLGSGLNIPLYTNAVEKLYGLEPLELLCRQSESLALQADFPVDVLTASAEEIPLPDNSIDTVVSTWTLCSIPDIEQALTEMRRVLRPDGRLLFMEHGHAPDANVAKWQKRLAPVFKSLAGCDPTRKMDDLILDAGFRINELDADYSDGPRILAYHYIGEARPL